jgi:hypothetical protein
VVRHPNGIASYSTPLAFFCTHRGTGRATEAWRRGARTPFLGSFLDVLRHSRAAPPCLPPPHAPTTPALLPALGARWRQGGRAGVAALMQIEPVAELLGAGWPRATPPPVPPPCIMWRDAPAPPPPRRRPPSPLHLHLAAHLQSRRSSRIPLLRSCAAACSSAPTPRHRRGARSDAEEEVGGGARRLGASWGSGPPLRAMDGRAGRSGSRGGSRPCFTARAPGGSRPWIHPAPLDPATRGSPTGKQ